MAAATYQGGSHWVVMTSYCVSVKDSC
jgi:hypothetical protein